MGINITIKKFKKKKRSMSLDTPSSMLIT